MKNTIPERSIGSIGPKHPATGIPAGGARARSGGGATSEEAAERIAAILLQEGLDPDAVRPHREPGPGDCLPQVDVQEAVKPSHGSRRDVVQRLRSTVQGRFEGKLESGAELAARQAGTLLLDAAAPPAADEVASPVVRTKVREAVRGSQRRFSRAERRVLVKAKRVEIERVARRFQAAGDPERGGVWSRSVYRQIRAAAQDASGRAAQCVLYMLGNEAAVSLASETDARVPMDRRRIALAYAIHMAPGSDLAATIKMGFALGLWAVVVADPNNPAMRRKRRFRPTRRTLSSDLTWLQNRGILKRWQVQAEHAAPIEMKRSPYPTNRYYAPNKRNGGTMPAIALALGDIPGALQPRPDEGWSAEDAEALERVRWSLLADLENGAPVAEGPDPPS